MTYRQLSLGERHRISALKQAGMTCPQIAREIGRNRITVYRELKRNHCPDGRYRVEKAQRRARSRRRLPTRNLRLAHTDLQFINTKLTELWSPQQIAGYGKTHGTITVSHQTIYRHIRQNRLEGGYLWRCLRTARKQKHKRYRSPDSRGRLAGKRSIDERSDEINQRLTIGHWEADTVWGSGKHSILTLVERKTGYALIGKLRARTVSEVNRVARDLLAPIQHLVKSITFDNGTEFHGYRELEEALDTVAYFAHPHHAWERGTNENTNGLIRQFLPKRTSMRLLRQERCNQIARRLNERPRLRLNYQTPSVVFRQLADVALQS